MEIKPLIFHWNNQIALDYVDYIKQECDLDALVISMIDHETRVLNYGLDQCEGYDYAWLLTPDLIISYPETPYQMAEWLDEHPDVAVLIPNREGEPRNFGGFEPYDKYLADGTAMIFRLSIGIRFDEEFIFTGWSDLDFGNEVEYQGYKVQVDPRTSVIKRATPYGSWSSFRAAYNARNRLLLEAKWHWAGRDGWRGVENWNEQNPERKIPSMFELAWYSETRLDKFAEGVNMEHPQILIKDGQDSGNVDWEFIE